MTLGDYRSDLAETLYNYKKNTEPKRGRPSSSTIGREIEAKRHQGPMKPFPPRDVRTDGLGHSEKRCTFKNRCKLPGCKGTPLNNDLVLGILNDGICSELDFDDDDEEFIPPQLEKVEEVEVELFSPPRPSVAVKKSQN
ncbi:unnamed protein product [Danaus chrysippus]|uniref:(African queen) hypothetical protein n=1 Tax=Danaus chrysippus TaxID=151541 RepID=A0A8J2VQ99_9NEOP|nr:unnamed protein product [Danaus chrysippus]